MSSNDTLATLIRQEALEAVQRPELDASTLPPHFYWSPEIYEHELETIFLREWICVGRADEIPKVGDFFTRTIASESVIVVRDTARSIRAHANFCRHRGCQVVTEPAGNTKSFRCPYHGWMYALDGELRGAPEFKFTHDFDKRDYPLFGVKVEVYEGFVFVNFDADAAPLAPRLTDTTKWGADLYGLAGRRTTHRWEWQLDCNWKAYVENFLEEYHVPWVHPETFQETVPMKQWIDFPDLSTQPWELQLARLREYTFSDSGRPLFPVDPALDGLPDDFAGLPVWCVYPSFMCLPAVDATLYYVAFPDAPEKTTVMMRLCLPDAVATAYEAGDPEIVPKVEEYVRNADQFIAEDNRICEIQQAGLRTRRGAAGRYCKHEPLVWKMHKWLIATAYGGAAGNGKDAQRGR
jgi:phenylpropionate dioxygenase-like ring-hydroxylating dioxygenase large terminal subunit